MFNLKSGFNRLGRLINWFTPSCSGGDERQLFVDRLLITICMITSVFSALYIGVSMVIGFAIGVFLMLACLILLFVIMFCFRAGGSYRWCANLYLACCFFVAILGCSYFTGGFHSSVFPWFALIPVAAVLLLGYCLDTMLWFMLSGLAMVTYGLATMSGFRFPEQYNRQFGDFFHMIDLVGLMIIVYLMALTFESNRSKALMTSLERNESLRQAQAELSQKAQELEAVNKELRSAHHFVQSSIQYASRIQRAILPPDDYFSGFVQSHFVLWEPRDVVGGDIYWCKPWGAGCLIILGDCTGHGVPGAFMTMLSSGALERAIGDISYGDVSGLMQRMHCILQNTLNQDGEHGHSDDGIEMGVCYLTQDKTKMIFAGARFDLYVLENSEVRIIKGSKSGMGYRGIPADQQFEAREINLNENMLFYLASDGIIDQIGAETGWGVGRKRMMQWLVEAGNLPLAEQKAFIYNSLKAYQGNERRRDDVAVIGFMA